MIAELTQDEVELVSGGFLLSEPVTGFTSGAVVFTNAGNPTDARREALARERFFRRNPTFIAGDFGFQNLP